MTERRSYIEADGTAKELDDQWFREARRGRPPVLNPKERVTIRLDPEVVAHFKNGGEKG